METTTQPGTNLVQVGLHQRQPDDETFAREIREGLLQDPKRLSSKYFYDGRGSALFQEIMKLPEYYLTRCEFGILKENKKEMARIFREQGAFHLVDLGAGDALKTKILLRQLLTEEASFTYLPVDISGDAQRQLAESLPAELPGLQLQAVVGEYLPALEWLAQNKPGPKVLLFLGSNIGNFDAGQSTAFLQNIRQRLQPGDRLLIGFDLRKNPNQIREAYDDAAGVTAAFNLNLLHRLNRELGANFEVEAFQHFAEYDPLGGVMRSFLVSRQAQEVYFSQTGDTFRFKAWEAIHTENSHKYSLEQIQGMAQETGFSVETSFLDKNAYFADVLLSVV